MLYMPTVISIIEVILVTVPALLTVAFVTVAERKTMASMQRRLGPNVVGYYGLLQAFADALKLILKEYVSPTQANLVLFFLGPIITLIFSLLGYAVVPYGPGLALWDFNIGILCIAIFIFFASYIILLINWSIGSKYGYNCSLALNKTNTDMYIHPALYVHLVGIKAYLAILLCELNISGILFTVLSFILSYIYINIVYISYTNSHLGINKFRFMVFKLSVMIIIPILIFLGIGSILFPKTILGLISGLIPIDCITMNYSQKDYSSVWKYMLEHMYIKGQSPYFKSFFPNSVQQYSTFEVINFVEPSKRLYVQNVISAAYNTVYPGTPGVFRGFDLLQSKILDDNKLTPLGKFFEYHNDISKL